MKKIIYFTAIASLLLFSCSKSDSPEVIAPSITVYKNQSTDVNADALQAQFKDSNFTVNIYGDFDADKTPNKVKTLTYQKANSDTIVNFIVNQLTSRIDAIYYAVNGVKSPVVIKFDYLTNATNSINVSCYNYDWQNNTSVLFYATTVDKTNPSQYGNPFHANRGINGGFKTDLSSVLTSMLLVDGVSLGLGGSSLFCTTIGAPVLAAVVTSGIIVPIAIAAIVGFVASAVNASELPPSDQVYPPNTQTTNPVTTTNNPVPHLPISTCTNTNIVFTAAMDDTGAIIFTTINGGQAPYTYMVESGFQQSTVFANNYANGSFLLAVKDANGCVNMNVMPLSRDSSLCGDVTDIDGNVYPSVTIGTQCWTQTNLNVSKYRNGDVIPQVTDPAAWFNLTTGAWCYAIYQGFFTTDKLYNWYAVNDPRGLAPAGYHIPSYTEWDTLLNFVGHTSGAIKSTNGGWNLGPTEIITNSSGFTAIMYPGCNEDQGYYIDDSRFWSSSQVNSALATMLYIADGYGFLSLQNTNKRWGLTVRCIKD